MAKYAISVLKRGKIRTPTITVAMQSVTNAVGTDITAKDLSISGKQALMIKITIQSAKTAVHTVQIARISSPKSAVRTVLTVTTFQAQTTSINSKMTMTYISDSAYTATILQTTRHIRL